MSTQSPPASSADPQLLKLYQVIGYYIARWSLVEELLYIIYFRASRLPEYACAEGFFAIDSYHVRTKFTIFTIRSKFAKNREKRDYWEHAVKSLNDFYSFRNFIAHNPVHEPQLRIDFRVPRTLVTRDYVVHTSFYQGRKPKKICSGKDIAEKAKQLDKAISRLRKEIAADFPEDY